MNPRSLIAISHDVLAAGVAWIAAFMLRFNFDVIEPWRSIMWGYLVPVMLAQGAISIRLRLYRGLWRYASLSDLRRIVVAAVLGLLVITTSAILLDLRELPRSVLVLYPILLAALMGAGRLGYRLWKEGQLINPKRADARRVMIIGAGEVGATLARTLHASPEAVVVGFLDDDIAKLGHTVAGVPVLGKLDELPALVAHHEIAQLVIAMPGASHARRRFAFGLATESGVPAFAVPAFDDLATGRVQVGTLRRVELEDLLGRDPIVLDVAGISSFIGGRTVLVTGAGGSIGSELCRQLASYRPQKLVFVESHEFSLYRINEEFRRAHHEIEVKTLVADVRDAPRIHAIVRAERPHIVFHAAAYKHVPLMEESNAWEAARNNILGTYNVAQAAIAAGTENFVLVSTDKAVNPTNVMGATKRASELVCQSLQQRSLTRFVTVRFGNVLGSTGSVVPTFRDQIALGGPITVTHPEITRFFMLIPEAAQLVLQAAFMGKGGEIFVLDMGQPVRIVDLARDMIRLSGLTEQDIPIVFTGLRPGEKLYEELLASDETSVPTPHPKVRVAKPLSPFSDRSLAEIVSWLDSDLQREPEEVRSKLKAMIPEYQREAGKEPHAGSSHTNRSASTSP